MLLIAGVGAMLGFGMLSVIFDNQILLQNEVVKFDVIEVGTHVDYEIPKVEEGQMVVKNAIVKNDSTFDWKEHVECFADNGTDLKRYIVMQGKVDTTKIGSYEVVFVLNWNGKSIVKKTIFYVEE